MQIRHNAICSIVQTARISTSLLFVLLLLLTLNMVALVEIILQIINWETSHEILSESWSFKFLRFACLNLSYINIKRSCRTLTRLNYWLKLKLLCHFLSLTVYHIVLRTVGCLG